jgi:hypothetical protein
MQRSRKGFDAAPGSFSHRQWKEEQYDLLAEHVRRFADVEKIYRLAGIGRR